MKTERWTTRRDAETAARDGSLTGASEELIEMIVDHAWRKGRSIDQTLSDLGAAGIDCEGFEWEAGAAAEYASEREREAILDWQISGGYLVTWAATGRGEPRVTHDEDGSGLSPEQRAEGDANGGIVGVLADDLAALVKED